MSPLANLPPILCPETLTLAIVFIFFIYNITKDRKKNRKVKPFPLPPGPKPWPMIGCLLDMVTNKPAFKWIHGYMAKINSEIACFRIGNVHVVSITSPELACEIVKKLDVVFCSRPRCLSADVISSGYMFAAYAPMGDHWKKMRRIITSSELFVHKKSAFLHQKFIEEADHIIRYVYNYHCNNPNKPINVRNLARNYAANMMRNMIFNKRYFGAGGECGGAGLEEDEHVASLFELHENVYTFSISEYMPCLSFLDFSGHQRNIMEALEVLTCGNMGLNRVHEDILDSLINFKYEDGKPILSPKEIKAQILDFMLAAIDNTSNAFEWALAEMINQPETLARATEEIDSVVGRDKLVQEFDLEKLNYLKSCAREAFRLHPFAAFNVPHESLSDAVVGGYFIPKGSRILLSRVGLGRNERVWTEPLRFKPERHLKSDDAQVFLNDPELRLWSFGTGRRGCLAVPLGSDMTYMLFARLLQGFTWSPPLNEQAIDLSETEFGLRLAKPLLAVPKPRLVANVY
ncbi:hypothetical protein Leryth_024581 [Lithospermum erythrorhizon]|nr:hypothetical protein Leryth_024581 [Lithospermum erythrorhizon]